MMFEKAQGNVSGGNDYTNVKGKAYDIEDALRTRSHEEIIASKKVRLCITIVSVREIWRRRITA